MDIKSVKLGDLLLYKPKEETVEVNGIDRDFITVEDIISGNSHVVVKEDFNKYEVLS